MDFALTSVLTCLFVTFAAAGLSQCYSSLLAFYILSLPPSTAALNLSLKEIMGLERWLSGRSIF